MNTSRDPPAVFGRTPAAAARAALLLFLLGGGAVAVLERLLLRPQTPLGDAADAAGVPRAVPLAVGLAVVLALALLGLRESLRTAERFRLTPEGLDVEGPFGAYRLGWENIAGVGVTPGGALGVRVRDRERVLATFRGTDRQREWLRTAPPYGEWDFLYPAADLGCPAEQVRGWLEPYQDRS